MSQSDKPESVPEADERDEEERSEKDQDERERTDDGDRDDDDDRSDDDDRDDDDDDDDRDDDRTEARRESRKARADREPKDGDPAESSRDAKEDERSEASLKGFWAFAKQTYASADPRSLGLFRIALATLLFVDVARRWPDVEAHYANTGWLTNHFALFRPMSSHLFSVYLACTTPGEVKTLMAIQLVICVLFAVGWKTRLMHVLSAILIVSIASRNIMLENGGWVVLNLLTVWTMFLPLGRRFSIDALLASLKARRESTVVALNDRRSPPRDTSPVISFAVAALLFQWIVIYYFNVVHKTGREWRDGSAVYYFFQQDRMVTALGAWARGVFPLSAYQFMTYGALAVESAIALLLASPFRAPLTRMIAWALCISLHLSIDAVVQLGPFSWAMVTAFWALIPLEAWNTLGPKWAARFPRRELCVDPESGFWLSFARIVKRFDVLEKIHFREVKAADVPERDSAEAASAEAAESEAASAEAAEAEAADAEADGDDEDEDDPEERRGPVTSADLSTAVGETLVVIDPKSNQRYHGLQALFRLFDAVPFGAMLLFPLRLPGLSGLAERWLRRAARKSEAADAYFEVQTLPGSPESPALGPTPARLAVLRGLAFFREGAVVALILACGSQVLTENRAIPKWLKPEERPEWMTSLVVYPRLFQGWSMFAPSPPRDDGRLVIEGVTKDGRKLDPLTGQAPSFEVQPKDGFRMNQIWGDFHRRIGEERFGGYLDGVKEMLKNFHKISGKPENELKSFEVWFVNEQIPPPGRPRAEPNRRKLFGWNSEESSPPPPPTRRRPTPPARQPRP